MKKTSVLIFLTLIILAGAVIWYANNRASKGPSLVSPSPSVFSSSSPSLITQAVYVCNEDKTINAAFYRGETKPVAPGQPPIPAGSVKIILSDGRNFDLPQTLSADGARYANSDESFVFWSKGDGAIVLENNVGKNYVGCVVSAKDAGSQGIKVISPNGGETWSKGQKVRISWSAAKEIKSVNIRLAVSGSADSQNFNAAIASGIPNTSSYEWTVQDLFAEVLGITALPASDKYLLTIEDSDHNNIYDMSDAAFSIK
jgi:membrane-bound inhibitor of C-type lysozyme